MRILNVAQTYHPYLDGGGMPVKVRAISRILARHGHNVTVLTAKLSSGGLIGQDPAERTPSGWRMVEDGVEAVYLPTLARYRALTFNPDMVRFCRNRLGQFDLVHCYGIYDLLGPCVSYFCSRQDVPFVVEPMGMFRPIDRGFRFKRAWHLTLGRSFLKSTSRIFVTSELEQEELVAGGIPADKLVLRRNGIDPDVLDAVPSTRGAFRSRAGLPADEPLIIFLSRLIPRKGADILIQAFADACPERGRLVIAGPEGENGYRNFLEGCARDSGAETRILFTGPLYGAEKAAALCDADLFVLPSRYENFANAPAEAIACGVPVILSSACGIAALVENRAGLVVRPERETLSKAIRRLLTDNNLRTSFKSACREVAAQLSWDTLVHQMEASYIEVLQARAS